MNTVIELLRESFSKYATLTAVKTAENALSYKDLMTGAESVAGCLAANAPAKAMIGIVGQRNFAVYEGIIGSVLSGCVYVPLNPKFPLQKKLNIIEQSQIRVLIASQADHNEVENLRTQSKIDLIIYPDADEVWVRGERRSLKSFAAGATAAIQSQDLIYVMYTSGSTGLPKGVMVSHGNVLALINNLNVFYPDLQPGYRCSQTFDLSFDPSVCDMFFTWMRGGTLCLMTAAEVFMPADYIRREEINFWHSVPMIGEYLGKLRHLKEGAFPSLRYTIFTGEPCKKTVADAWRVAAPNSSIENRYGPTELTVDCLRYNYLPGDSQKNFINGLLPIGLPYTTLESQIVNDKMEKCSSGEKGELVVAGPQVTLGYLKDPEKTAKVFVRMPWDTKNQVWYRTGDSAVIDEGGSFNCLGRIDNQIKLAGKRVEIGEIEYNLISTGLVKEAIVVPCRSQDGTIQSVVAFCEKELSTEDISQLKNLSQKGLDPSFFPKKFYQIKDVPLLSNGKVDRQQLQSLAQQMMGT
jgi:D-alanine--poly(phosphoribitol) ligase subunit 1